MLEKKELARQHRIYARWVEKWAAGGNSGGFFCDVGGKRVWARCAQRVQGGALVLLHE